jgi:hypothetical protein
MGLNPESVVPDYLNIQLPPGWKAEGISSDLYSLFDDNGIERARIYDTKGIYSDGSGDLISPPWKPSTQIISPNIERRILRSSNEEEISGFLERLNSLNEKLQEMGMQPLSYESDLSKSILNKTLKSAKSKIDSILRSCGVRGSGRGDQYDIINSQETIEGLLEALDGPSYNSVYFRGLIEDISEAKNHLTQIPIENPFLLYPNPGVVATSEQEGLVVTLNFGIGSLVDGKTHATYVYRDDKKAIKVLNPVVRYGSVKARGSLESGLYEPSLGKLAQLKPLIEELTLNTK